MSAGASTDIPVVYRILTGAFDRADVAVKFADEARPAILESVCDTAGYGRFSIFACTPVATAAADACDAAAMRAAIDLISRRIDLRRPADLGHLPLVAGWIGCIPYEAGAALVPGIAQRPRGTTAQRLEFALYDAAIIHDRVGNRWYACAVDLPESTSPAAQRVECMIQWLSEARGAASQFTPSWPTDHDLPTPDVTRSRYLRAIRRALEYIAAGDIYQVNLTQRFTVRTPLSPLEIYLRLRAANASDFAALLVWGQRAVISASPELFLSATADGAVLTRPIKGTHTRGGSGSADAAAGTALLASAKDRAELNMIIDLLRNDLGRVCEYGSVRVLADAEVEVHPTVLHLVGTVAGQLRPEVTRNDLLQATLPGGSITGCPKIRAMQIIRELEQAPRGAYCGAIGYLGLDGTLGLNVAIRTMQYDRGALHLHAGGAITADSDPLAEYAETLAKAEGMFRALGHTTATLDATAALR